jgi:hypothetical protein
MKAPQASTAAGPSSFIDWVLAGSRPDRAITPPPPLNNGG